MRQWEAQINKLIKELAQRRAVERPLAKIAAPNSSLCRIDSTTQIQHIQSSVFSASLTCNSRYSRPSQSTSTIGDESVSSPGLPGGSYTSIGSLSNSESFEFEVDEEDYAPTSSYASSGRGTPMIGRRSTVGERDSISCDRPESLWRAPLPPSSASSARPVTPRLHSVPSMHSDSGFGNQVRNSRPSMRSQISSTRLKSSYNDNGEYYDGSGMQSPIAPTLGVPPSSRSRSISQPTAYVPKGQLPPVPPGATQSSQWSRDRSNTNFTDGATSCTGSSHKRGSGSSQSTTGDSSDYSPNSSSSPITPYGSSESSLNGVGIGTQTFDNVSNGTEYLTSPPCVKVKIYFHEDVFVIEVPRHTEYVRLVEKVGRKIRLCGPRRDDGPLRVKYRDEDGDMVSLGSTEDVQMAFSEFRPGGQVTLFVT
jgi:cell division control protein 24